MSTMRVVNPEELTEPNLVSSTVARDDYPEWDSATTYDTGDRVIFGVSAWEALADGVTSQPDEGVNATPPEWVRLGFINRWKMFRAGVDSKTRDQDLIEVEFTPTQGPTTVTLLGLEAQSVTLINDDGFSETRELVDIGVEDWWEFYFLDYKFDTTATFDDIPIADGATFTASIESDGSEVSCGRLVYGRPEILGLTLVGTDLSILDFSRKQRNEFGELELVPRRTIRTIDYNVAVSTPDIGFIEGVMSRLSATPALYLGSDDYGFVTIYGVFQDFRVNIQGPEVSNATIQVEGF